MEHAEVNAIQSVENKSLLSQCTVYVNLEPCAHLGKTAPCADLLIKHRVSRVVVSNTDPNPLVSGKGIQKLKEAGIDVVIGICAEQGLQLNRRFFTFMNRNRPFVILKWAQTVDGFLARENFDSKWISNEYSRQLVHKWRSEEDAILVGYNTAHKDNPQLTVRDWSGRDPIRVVIDLNLQLDHSLHLFDQSQKTICYNFKKDESRTNLLFVRMEEKNWLEALLKDLFLRNVQSIIIEGGSKTLSLFLQSNMWDEARVFRSSGTFENGIKAPNIETAVSRSENIQGDELMIYRNN
jgi:diaminohydroxyphosphoribosylaminopyrimidine deaminase/5-amino-6-(5-phosphoribosylamino)uracil reductase